MKLLALLTFLLFQSLVQARIPTNPRRQRIIPPVAKAKNGTYQGVYSPEYDQDFFLGIPYAQAPVGNLRFRNPRSYNETWDDKRLATNYSAACVGYGPSQIGYNTSEDCLYLNIVRPPGHDRQCLPVAVWIHGGGYVQGSGVDRRYNLSYIVQHSVKIRQPMIAVSINYRLSAWGFLNSAQAFEDGSSNMGLRDQRLSLHWIKENIAAFGGDPTRVTLWGQSAGAASVGAQMLAFNGRDDHLFRAAIMQSGTPLALGSQKGLAEAPYKLLLERTGCHAAYNAAMQCLRDLTFGTLNKALNTTELAGVWTPKIDGDFVARHSSKQLRDGHFVKIPIIVGATTDEGTSFTPKGINTTPEFQGAIENSSPAISPSFARKILEAYPTRSHEQILRNVGVNFVSPSPYGLQYRRTATYYGDVMMVAPRRLTAEIWSKNNHPVYSYRFNAIPAWVTYLDGATHFVDVAFSMFNLEGEGYPPIRKPPFQGLPESYKELAVLMAGDFIKFIGTGNPNDWEGRKVSMASMDRFIPRWPKYKEPNGLKEPRNYVYDGNATIAVESDSFRSEAIILLNLANFEVYDR